MHSHYQNNKTSSKKRISDLFANNLLGAHDMVAVCLSSHKFQILMCKFYQVFCAVPTIDAKAT